MMMFKCLLVEHLVSKGVKTSLWLFSFDVELEIEIEGYGIASYFWYKQEIKLMISYTSLAVKKALTAFTSLSNKTPT
jgi:hypothetical protein